MAMAAGEKAFGLKSPKAPQRGALSIRHVGICTEAHKSAQRLGR